MFPYLFLYFHCPLTLVLPSHSLTITKMHFYGLGGYGYTPAFRNESRTSSGSHNRPQRRTTPTIKRISTQVGSKVRRISQSNPSNRRHREYGSKPRLLVRLAWWLDPRRWLAGKVKHAACSPGAPVIPPINMGDALFLESLVRHAEDSSFVQPRASTLPLLHRPSNTPTENTTYGGSMPPDILPTIVYDIVPPEDHGTLAIDSRGMQRTPINNHVIGCTVPTRTNSNMVLLRSPHPPSSYQGLPLGVIHSRPSSQSGCSLATSCYDPHDFPIGSLSESVLSGTTSPLFYRPTRDSILTTPASPVLGEQSVRRKSVRISSLPESPAPAPRAGSLTVSIRTEEGMEELEFPSPPRWSGCWFSDRSNNQTPVPPNALSVEDETSEDGEDYGEYDPTGSDAATTMAHLAQISEKSQESFTESITESGASSSSACRLPIPHMRTFGPHATSFFSSRKNQNPDQVSIHDDSRSRVDMSSDGFDGHKSGMDSVCSAFADVSMNSSPALDDDDPLSDTDSFADPAFRHQLV